MQQDSGARQRRIVALVRERGGIALTELVDELDVVPETVRRDLTALERRGLVRRTRGHAHPVETASFETSIDYRAGHLVAEKRRIAQAAVQELGAVESLYLDDGFTPLLIARALVRSPRPCTVLTPSLDIASTLAGAPDISVMVLGGPVRAITRATSGHWAVDMLAGFTLDAAVVGTNGISRERGLTIPVPGLCPLKRAALDAARRRICVTAHSKFGVDSFARFADVGELELVITDTGLPLAEAKLYQQLGPRVLRA